MQEQESTSVVSDAELVADLRAGNRQAMTELYTRHNADAERVGRIVCPQGDAEELVAEAFARVFTTILNGGGPSTNFRAYLHAVIRNLNIERSKRASREQPASDRTWLLETVAEEEGEDVDAVDAARAAHAFSSLPQNWQQLLWKLEVEGTKPAQVATELSLPVATVSDTAYRAREGLRLAYLNQHLPVSDKRRCDWTHERLGRLARGGLSPRASAKARSHLDGCVDCATLFDEIYQLNTRLGAAIWPIVLIGGIAISLSGNSPSEPRTPSDSPGQLTPRTLSATPRTSGQLIATFRRLATVPTAVMATVVVAVAAVSLWALKNDPSPEGSASPPQDSAPTQRPTPVSEVPPPDSIDALLPGILLLTEGNEQAGQATPAPTKTTPAGPKEEPGPEPTPEPDPEPVDLEIGAPTIEAADEPYQWRLTVPVLATEGAAATGFTAELELTVSEPTGFIERLSAGWDCGAIEEGGSNGDPYFFGGDVPVSCRYTYQPGQAVAPLQLILESVTEPTGSVTVSGIGNADPNTSNDHRTF